MYTTRTGQRDCCKVPQGSPVLYTLTVYINRRNRSRERIKSPPTGSCSLGVEASTINKRKKETSLPTPNMSAGRKQDALIIGTRFFFGFVLQSHQEDEVFLFPTSACYSSIFFCGKSLTNTWAMWKLFFNVKVHFTLFSFFLFLRPN